MYLLSGFVRGVPTTFCCIKEADAAEFGGLNFLQCSVLVVSET